MDMCKLEPKQKTNAEKQRKHLPARHLGSHSSGLRWARRTLGIPSQRLGREAVSSHPGCSQSACDSLGLRCKSNKQKVTVWIADRGNGFPKWGSVDRRLKGPFNTEPSTTLSLLLPELSKEWIRKDINSLVPGFLPVGYLVRGNIFGNPEFWTMLRRHQDSFYVHWWQSTFMLSLLIDLNTPLEKLKGIVQKDSAYFLHKVQSPAPQMFLSAYRSVPSVQNNE